MREKLYEYVNVIRNSVHVRGTNRSNKTSIIPSITRPLRLVTLCTALKDIINDETKQKERCVIITFKEKKLWVTVTLRRDLLAASTTNLIFGAWDPQWWEEGGEGRGMKEASGGQEWREGRRGECNGMSGKAERRKENGMVGVEHPRERRAKGVH